MAPSLYGRQTHGLGSSGSASQFTYRSGSPEPPVIFTVNVEPTLTAMAAWSAQPLAGAVPFHCSVEGVPGPGGGGGGGGGGLPPPMKLTLSSLFGEPVPGF